MITVQPRLLGKALEVVTRAIGTYLVKKAGFTHKTAKTGAVILIQRFGSALNLNIHFHMLFLDGVYEVDSEGTTAKFHVIEAPPYANETLAEGWVNQFQEAMNDDFNTPIALSVLFQLSHEVNKEKSPQLAYTLVYSEAGSMPPSTLTELVQQARDADVSKIRAQLDEENTES